MNTPTPLMCLLVTAAAVAPVTAQPKSDPPGYVSREDMSEEALIQRIKRLDKFEKRKDVPSRQAGMRPVLLEETLSYVDTLLNRFVDSGYRSEATIVKLKVLAELARTDEARLEQLLDLTHRISDEKPVPPLASENAFYGIQAFVLGARREKMPTERRLLGTAERYEAFLLDFPNSPHVPVMRASFVRNLLAQEKVDRARAELQTLERDHPNHRATSRARGELYRVDAVDKPFVFHHTTSDGQTIQSKDYLGKVVVVHFWATWSAPSRDALPKLVGLYRTRKDRGLQLIGVNVDKSRNQIGKALDSLGLSWPQYFDEKGLENDAFVAMGVRTVPTYFVVDRKGILRHITRSDDLAGLVDPLLAEPAKKP